MACRAATPAAAKAVQTSTAMTQAGGHGAERADAARTAMCARTSRGAGRGRHRAGAESACSTAATCVVAGRGSGAAATSRPSAATISRGHARTAAAAAAWRHRQRPDA